MNMIIRPLEVEDRSLLEAWIQAEPDHAATTPEFYFQPKTKTVVYEDEQGPVFAVRYSSALRIDIEFSNTANKERIGKVLKEGFPIVAEQAKQQGFSQLIFSSLNQKLVRFCRKFGFVDSPEQLRTL